MRTIKFRGKTTGENPKWVFGDHYVSEYADCYISDAPKKMINTVAFNSIGQFTGLHDKNGKEIFEGDILKGSTGRNYEVGFKNGWFLAKNGSVAILGAEMKAFEVVGNIYENPEYSDGVFG